VTGASLAEAAADLINTGPGGICDDCGHFAGRHVGNGCMGFPEKPCNTCGGMLWMGHRIEMRGEFGGPVTAEDVRA
jgi:hypothetical protein